MAHWKRPAEDARGKRFQAVAEQKSSRRNQETGSRRRSALRLRPWQTQEWLPVS